MAVTYKLVYLARRAVGISREDWPRTWKSHAVFASQFPALESGIAWMLYCNRAEPALPGLSLEHDGVAVAGSSRLEAIDGSGFSDADRALIDRDELRVFDRLTPEFTFRCEEEVLRDGPRGEAAVFRFLAPAAGADPAEFARAWRQADPACAGATRVARNLPLHAAPPLFPFHGIEEFWFDDLGQARAAIEAGLAKVDGNWCDREASTVVLTQVCHRWPRAPRG
jgi:hypothetical protein